MFTNNGPHPSDLFPGDRNFRSLLYTYLLPEDSTSFQFSEPVSAVNSFGSIEKAVDEFAKILLPDQELKKEENR
jgi:hypothetical protein